jgi:hypothetical protein
MEFVMSTIGKSLLISGAAALLMSVAAVAPAQAHGKKLHFHGFGHHHHHHHHHKLHFHSWGHGCGYYKRMWWRTGSYYWKVKYYDCISY